MPHEIDFVDDSQQWAHRAMLEKIMNFAEATGWWEVLYYDDQGDNHEVMLKGEGFSGNEEIFVGFRTYESVSNDVYNMVAATFTGYVPGTSFFNQPGRMSSGVPAHNARIDYWLTVNPQRIALVMKVGTPVYESCYVGKFFPYATPNQYPYPVVCAGMLNGEPLTRYSDMSHSIPYKGDRANMRMRFVDGVWRQPDTWPWNNSYLARTSTTSGSFDMRDTDDHYPLLPVVLNESIGNFGELDGIHYITGFANAVENTLTIDGVDYVVVQDVTRTGFIDYFAMRLDTEE